MFATVAQIGLEGSGSVGEFLLAVFLLVGTVLAVLVLGRLFDAYF